MSPTVHTTMLALSAVLIGSVVTNASAQTTTAPLAERPSWVVKPAKLNFAALVGKAEEAIKANKMGLVTTASASEGAKAQGFTIAGNRVIGVFRNDFARRMLAASIPAGIEAPIRLYITENADGTATLSYKTPSAVFAPYIDGAPSDLKTLAGELDGIFAKIADDATKP